MTQRIASENLQLLEGENNERTRYEWQKKLIGSGDTERDPVFGKVIECTESGKSKGIMRIAWSRFPARMSFEIENRELMCIIKLDP